jgi:hypothetical protein
MHLILAAPAGPDASIDPVPQGSLRERREPQGVPHIKQSRSVDDQLNLGTAGLFETPRTRTARRGS